jgi:hypothetical protein
MQRLSQQVHKLAPVFKQQTRSKFYFVTQRPYQRDVVRGLFGDSEPVMSLNQDGLKMIENMVMEDDYFDNLLNENLKDWNQDIDFSEHRNIELKHWKIGQTTAVESNEPSIVEFDHLIPAAMDEYLPIEL